MPDRTRKTDEELKALLELEAKALPAPWAVFDSAINSLGVGRDEEDEPYVAECIEESSDEPTQANRDNFAIIAASRNSIRDIILDLQASRERERELVEALKETFEFFQGPNACGDFTCTCCEVKFCGICALRGKNAAVLARAEAKEKQT